MRKTMRSSWWWFCPGFILLAAIDAGAQCANGSVWASQASSNACSGTNVYEGRVESRRVELTATVSCNQSGYYGDEVSKVGYFVEANGQCGPAPAGFRPDCHGQVDDPHPRGYDMYTETWKADVGVRHWGWNGSACTPTAP